MTVLNNKKDEYIFELSQDDVNELKKNIDAIKRGLMGAAKSDAISDYKRKEESYVWRNTELRKKENAK